MLYRALLWDTTSASVAESLSNKWKPKFTTVKEFETISPVFSSLSRRSMRAEFSGRIFKVRGQSVASTSEEGVSSYKNQMNLRMEIQKCQQGQKRN